MNSTDRLGEEWRDADHLDLIASRASFCEGNGVGDDHLIDHALGESADRWTREDRVSRERDHRARAALFEDLRGLTDGPRGVNHVIHEDDVGA